MTEQWRPVPGLEGKYEVSSQGRVRSWAPKPGLPLPRFLVGTITHGYHRVTLSGLDGRGRHRSVHSLVAEAFIGPRPSPDIHVRHLDGDKLNNAISNIAYGTASENQADNIRLGRNPMAARDHCSRGHRYTPDNTRRDSTGKRVCRRCGAMQQRRFRRARGIQAQKPRGHIEHGTRSGYRAHLRLGLPVPADDACGCREALRVYNKAAGARRRAVTAENRLSA